MGNLESAEGGPGEPPSVSLLPPPGKMPMPEPCELEERFALVLVRAEPGPFPLLPSPGPGCPRPAQPFGAGGAADARAVPPCNLGAAAGLPTSEEGSPARDLPGIRTSSLSLPLLQPSHLSPPPRQPSRVRVPRTPISEPPAGAG